MINVEMPQIKIITISQLNRYVKSVLDQDAHLSDIFVTGEISNLTDHYSSGHIYFSLKDKGAVVKSVMFAYSARNLKFKPEDGMKVIVRGRVSLYENTGAYQLYVEDMIPDGVGSLTVAYEQLKNKLEAQGLFDEKHKKSIPQFPKTVGVITSPTGAAVQDIRNILYRRFPSVDVVLYPVLVQGTEAAKQLVEAVNTFNEYDCADVIIIGRGGGSIEDLWAFNDEDLAYAIYASNIPVISAVGHETDFTICDFVADLRAPTPSAGAELAVPDKEELLSYYKSQQQYLSSMMDLKITNINMNLTEYKRVLDKNSCKKKITDCYDKLRQYENALFNAMNIKLIEKEKLVRNSGGKLEALNPVSVLQRGYSFAKKDDKVINSVKELKKDDLIQLTFKDGTINTKVIGN